MIPDESHGLHQGAKPKQEAVNATMITHQGVTASPHRAEKLGLDTGQLGKGHIPCCGVDGALDNREVSWLQDVIQSNSKSLLKQVEGLS